METHSLIVIPFQLIFSIFLVRAVFSRVDCVTYVLICIALAVDFIGMFIPDFLPLSSFLLIFAFLRYYDKGNWAKVYALGFNFFMYLIYSKIPMGAYFVTAVNYYVAYTVMQSTEENEIFIKNILYYASLRHLSIVAGYWLASKIMFAYVAEFFSVVVVYYMIRAIMYYKRQNGDKKE
jgi:hypothetical protein